MEWCFFSFHLVSVLFRLITSAVIYSTRIPNLSYFSQHYIRFLVDSRQIRSLSPITNELSI